MKPKFFLAFVCLIILGSCDFLERNFSWDIKEKSETSDGAIRSYYENGKLRSICYVDSAKRKHGICISYYESGTVKNKITYNHGEKVRGISHYKSTGKPALDISYKNGMKNGIRRKYYENGNLASEFEYKNNRPGKGLVEYKRNGGKVKGYPKLIVKPIDLIDTHGKYILEIYFDRDANRGEYFLGELLEDKYLITGPQLARLKDEDGIVSYELFVPKGMFRMEKLNFVAKYKTKRGNPHIAEKSFNLAVDNPI
ncbi:MAG: hypothetical protein AAF620_09685 [Bacteroidota bacterium]